MSPTTGTRPAPGTGGGSTPAAWAVTAYALLTTDGRWIDLDGFGAPAGPVDGELAVDAYARESDAYLDGLGDDHIVVRLLCHC